MSGQAEMVPKIVVAVAFVAMVALNGISAAGVFGMDVGTISDENPTFITPDGRTFAVWGVIYLLHLGLVVGQFRASDEEEHGLLAQPCPLTGLSVRWRIVVAFGLNGVWLPAWTSLRFTAALVIIAFYLGVLVSLYISLNTRTASSSFCQWLTFAAPIAANGSWLLVATMTNIFVVAGGMGWKDPNGVAGSERAAFAVVCLVCGIACFLALQAGDVLWPAVAAWALAGIYRAQTTVDAESFPPMSMSANLGKLAAVCSALAAFAALGGAYVAAKIARERQSAGGHALLQLPSFGK